MPDLKGFEPLNKTIRNVPDYTGDSYWAKVLCKKIESFYKRLGYQSVKAWIEVEESPLSGRKIYNVRSNLRFNVDSLQDTY